MDLKPGEVRIFQCESCGEIFDPLSQEAKALMHTATCVGRDIYGNPEPEPCPCGPISERILVDTRADAAIRREVIEAIRLALPVAEKAHVTTEELLALLSALA